MYRVKIEMIIIRPKNTFLKSSNKLFSVDFLIKIWFQRRLTWFVHELIQENALIRGAQ
jgi:hypothetical protein